MLVNHLNDSEHYLDLNTILEKIIMGKDNKSFLLLAMAIHKFGSIANVYFTDDVRDEDDNCKNNVLIYKHYCKFSLTILWTNSRKSRIYKIIILFNIVLKGNRICVKLKWVNL